jgi:hypothetical protein
MERSKKSLLVSLVAACILGMSAPSAQAYDDYDDITIVMDLLVLRPVGLLATIGGSVIFVGSLPLSLPTWSVGKTFEAYVKRPAAYTFWRELGEPRT